MRRVTIGMTNFEQIDNKVYFHPGYYLQEMFYASELEFNEFANSLGLTSAALKMLIRGQKRITPSLADTIAKHSDTSYLYWLRLQHIWDMRGFVKEK
jgi:addiction module HigA family antidote